WLLNTPNSMLHWEAVLTSNRVSLPDKYRYEIWQVSQDSGESVAATFSRVAQSGVLRPAQRQRLLSLAEFWNLLEISAGTTAVAGLLLSAMHFLRTNELVGYAEPGPWFDHLLLLAQSYGDDLGGYLEATALRSDVDLVDPRADRVTLMTLHAAKGLEFPVVFMAGCEEGLLPYLPESDNRVTNLEEERRLFYVGMTRAQEKLIMTRAARRFLYGQRREFAISPYLSDIESALLEVHESRARASQPPRAADLQLSLF
ncbi:MAG: 3'-5' exonuclease, partial [Caldilineaceae bacterium]